MNTRNVVAFARGSIFASLTVTTMAACLPILSTPASADPRNSPPDTTVQSAPPAVPNIPDVGQPGEGRGPQTEPTINPRGKPVWPTENSPSRVFTARDGWTAVISVVDGARIRTQPVTGTVIGLIPYEAYYWISCKKGASDGTVWGYATHDRRYGWVRSDLWAIVRPTAPHAPPTRPIPWC